MAVARPGREKAGELVVLQRCLGLAEFKRPAELDEREGVMTFVPRKGYRKRSELDGVRPPAAFCPVLMHEGLARSRFLDERVTN